MAEKAKTLATRRIGVLPFQNLSGKQQFGEVGQVMAEKIITFAMNSNPEFMEFVTREFVADIMHEQSFGQSGAVSAGTR